MKRFSVSSIVILFLISTLAPVSANEKTRVDIMIAYTPAVTEFYNGHDGVLAHAIATVAGTNAVLENSGADMFFYLVHVAEIDYEESDSFSTDLSRLRDPSDGYMDEVHSWRDEWGADLVSLFRRGSTGGTAGLAYMLTNPDGSPAWGFSVVSDVAALSGFTFAHELGHNMGAAHAHGDPGVEGIFEYARGHRFFGQDSVQYRTVMAYAPGTRIPHFSNPNVLYEGTPTGVPVNQSNPADVVETFADTGPLVSGYRPAQTFLPEVLREPRDMTIVEGGTAVLSALVNGIPPVDLQWFRGEAGDTSQPVAGGTETILQTDPLFNTSRFWLRVTTAEGTATSRAAKVAVVPPPSGPYEYTLQQPNVESGFRINREQWQQIFPVSGYVHSIGVRLWKQGEPGGVHIEFADGAGNLLAAGTIPGSAISGSLGWHTIPAGLFVVPGHPYRIQISPAGFYSDDDYVLWAGQVGEYPEGISSVENSAPGYAFTFRISGTDAWTYHTWLADQDLTGSEAEPDFRFFPGGLPNLLRYVLNLDPGEGPGGLPFASGISTLNGDDYLSFVFRQRKALQDVTLFVESSADLQGWDPVSSAHVFALPDADEDTKLFEARVPLDEGDRFLFLRLNASLPD